MMIRGVKLYVAVCSLLVVHVSVSAFVLPGSQQNKMVFYSAPSEDDKVSTAPPATIRKESTRYPIDLASPVLLSSSMLSAAVSTSSAFQLTTPGVDPLLGVPATNVVVFTGIPVGFFLLYAAYLKYIAEMEQEDNEAFVNGN